MHTCKCQCKNFREHALGVTISKAAMPTRSNVKEIEDREARWQRDGDAYARLAPQGYAGALDGCADFEAQASEKIELEHGTLYGEEAKVYAEVSEALSSEPAAGVS